MSRQFGGVAGGGPFRFGVTNIYDTIVLKNKSELKMQHPLERTIRT